MTHVHYKFSSKLSYDTVVFDGPHVTLRDLKRQIMGREKLRAGDCDLQITNAQSKEEYLDDECSIPKGSSVIVRRIPVIGSKPSSSKTRHVERSDGQTHQAFGAYRAMEDQSSSKALPLFSKMANLADVDGSEEDKIKVMINQSTYDAMNYNKKFGTVLPANYTCYRCGNTGHHIRNCPVSGDKNFDAPARIKKSTGIPRSFMVEVDDPNTKGAMLTNCGRYAVPSIDIAAYAIGKKERPPFGPQEDPKSEEEEEPAPEELLCVICRDLMSDAVVIPCCGNSYCDDCIRSALLDSEDHVCPTCGQSNVSPDTLIANKFLRQAVETFKKERCYDKTLPRGSFTSQSQDPTPSASPVPTPPPLGVPSQPQKPHVSTQQDPLRSQAADTSPPPQMCVAPPAATSPASSPGTPSAAPPPEQIPPEEPDREAQEKTNDESAAAAPSAPGSPEVPPDAPTQLMPLVIPTPPVEPPLQAAAVDLEQPPSGPAPKCTAPSTCWESSSSSPLCPAGGWSESSNQQLRPSSSPYPATPPPPLFPPPHFHTFLAAQQPLSGYPPGYPPPTPMWTLPNLQGAPIPSLCPSTAIPALIPKEWYRKERSPDGGSSSRRSSSRSDPKSSKLKPSHSYSRSSSRSRSRSHGRSRPPSPYSRHKDLHSRSHPSRSYSFGYKRSPTPSSSSSPRGGYHSRPKSPADPRHSRRHGKKSASGGGSASRRRGEHGEREAGASGGSLPGHLYARHANPACGGLDRKSFLQWSREYKEWCDKYFSSYVGHFHQLPLPLLNIPPPPQWEGWEGGSGPRSRRHGRRAARTGGRSPPSRSSSGSRSPPSRSSRDSRSTLSRSSSDSRSSPSRSSNGSLSSASRSSSDRRSTPPKGGVQPRARAARGPGGHKSREDEKRENARNSETLATLKHEQKKKHEEGGEESSSLDAADSADDCREDKRRRRAGPKASRDEATAGEALEPVRPERRLDKEDERRRREHRDVETEKGRRRGRHSDSRQDVGRRHKEAPGGERDTRRADRRPAGSAGPDPRSHRSRKRKGEDIKRSSRRADNSKCLKTNAAEDPESRRSESPNPFDKKTPKAEQSKARKAWPLTERDVWEGGISVKPQKKISININLEGKREEKTEKQQFCYFENTREEMKTAGEKENSNRDTEANENKSSREVEGLSEENVQPNEGEARQKWEKATFRDDKGEKTSPALTVEETTEQSPQLWDERGGTEASKGGEVRDERRGAEAGQDVPMEGGEWRTWEDEEDESHRSISQIHQDAAKPPGEDSSGHEDPQEEEEEEEEEEVKALEECGEDRAADQEDQLLKVKVARSKWDKEEPEEDERVEGAARAQTEAPSSVLPSSSVRVTSQTTANRERGDGEKRARSGEAEAERGREIQKNPVGSSSHRSGAPSGGRDRKDSTVNSDRDRQRRRDRDRGREGERPGGGQRESRRSTERARDEERGRGRERERKHASVASAKKRNPPPSSRSRSRDTERGGRQRGGDPADARSSPRPGRKLPAGRSRESGAPSRAPELPDPNPHRSCRDAPKDKDHPHSYHNAAWREGRAPDGRSRWEAARELEDGERPSSHSSAASQEKGEKKEKRPEEDERRDKQSRPKRGGDGREGRGGGQVDASP